MGPLFGYWCSMDESQIAGASLAFLVAPALLVLLELMARLEQWLDTPTDSARRTARTKGVSGKKDGPAGAREASRGQRLRRLSFEGSEVGTARGRAQRDVEVLDSVAREERRRRG